MLDNLLGDANAQENLFGAVGIVKELTKPLMARLLEVKLDEHLGYGKHSFDAKTYC